MVEILIIVVCGIVFTGLGFFVAKRVDALKYQIYLEQAKAKAKAIEHEAELLLQNSKAEIKNLELELRKKLDEDNKKLKIEHENKLSILIKKEEALESRIENEIKILSHDRHEIKKSKDDTSRHRLEAENLKKEAALKLQDLMKQLSAITGYTKDEAKTILFDKIENEYRDEIAHIVRKYETEAKTEARKRANFIIAQATTRFAGEFASERLINVVTLPTDEVKGRVIGKEGRNIKVLENLLGVDIIIDDTPNAIILSSFNLYRRAIATRTLELLIEDGRIQPTRIEEIYEKVKAEFEERLLQEGEQIVIDLGIGHVHTDLIKLIGRLKFRASYGQNALSHSLEVAYLAGMMAAEMGGDEKLAKRAGLLHDIGKALTHEYNGNHIDLGADVCKRYKEHPIVINAIYAHHEHEEAKSIECAAVCTADAISAARPGARREVLESFLKRVQQIEEIAMSKNGVKSAYAISAGKEIRVTVNSQLINDDESALVSKEIARDIQNKVQYPGEIKVTVIRELRNIEYAK
jgi:ribonuclease Y